MKILKIIIFILFSCSLSLRAQQQINGVVLGKSANNTEPLFQASIFTIDKQYFTYTDSAGRFQLTLPDSYQTIICSYPGYKTDTIFINSTKINIQLQDVTQLSGVVITGNRDQSYISSLQTLKTEVITSEGLKKNACCNLAESFESNPTIDGSSSDAVTGQRTVQMLGLSGIYVQMLTDMIPDLRGLNIITGLTALPGPFIHNIYIRKGPGSVANSYEGITGQIDVELIKPYDADKLFLNFYANTQQRLEGNVYFRNQIKKWKSLTMLHGSTAQLEMDYNKDSFLDNPVYTVFTGIHRWQHINKHGKETHLGFKYHYDDARSFNTLKHIHHLPDSAVFQPYLFKTLYHREEVFAKTCLELFGNERNELGLQVNALHHDQQTRIGNRNYRAIEQGLYLNSNFQILPHNENLIYRFGGGLMYSNYIQYIDSLDLSRKDVIPGAFAELTYNVKEKFSLIAGLRGDYYNNNRKFYMAPRIHLRYKIGEEAFIRASAGYGWRVANIIQENLNYLVSSRTIITQAFLQPEYALNYGINFTQNIDIAEREFNWSVDVYRTQFIQQVVVDVDQAVNEIRFYNLNGKSYANSIQLQCKYEPIKHLNLLLAGKYNDVRVTYHGQLMQRPFTPQWRGMFNAAYSFWKERIKLDATLQYVGPQRIALNLRNEQSGTSEYSPGYFRVLSQIAYDTKRFEIYVGGENLNGFTQKNPIISAFDPYGAGFDAAMIWGPIMSRIFYTGIRYTFK